MNCADKQIVKVDNPFSITVLLKIQLHDKELLLKLNLITFNTSFDIVLSFQTSIQSGILSFIANPEEYLIKNTSPPDYAQKEEDEDMKEAFPGFNKSKKLNQESGYHVI